MEMNHENLAIGTTIRRASEDGQSSPGSRMTRVWLVDDDDALRDLMAELLNHQSRIRCPRQFSTTASLLEALENGHLPDVLLLDINLGGENGIDAIGAIKSRAPSVQVLMFTTFFDRQLEEQAFERGASGFLLKSCDIQEIVRLIIAAHARQPAAGLFSQRPLAKPRIRAEAQTILPGPHLGPSATGRSRLMRMVLSILTL